MQIRASQTQDLQSWYKSIQVDFQLWESEIKITSGIAYFVTLTIWIANPKPDSADCKSALSHGKIHPTSWYEFISHFPLVFQFHIQQVICYLSFLNLTLGKRYIKRDYVGHNCKKTMELLANLEKGLEVIEPYLKQHDFGFKDFENFKGPNGRFTFVKYKNGLKEFHLGYDFSIRHVVYQFDSFAVSHDFYLNKLGFADKKMFNGAQTDDELFAFSNILHDFNFLVNDFFKGECIRLKEISRFRENIIAEYGKKAPDDYNLEFDKLRIERARQEFRSKNFPQSLEIYRSIEYKELLNALDEKLIEFCTRQI